MRLLTIPADAVGACNTSDKKQVATIETNELRNFIFKFPCD